MFNWAAAGSPRLGGGSNLRLVSSLVQPPKSDENDIAGREKIQIPRITQRRFTVSNSQ